MIVTCIIMIGVLVYDISHATPIFYEFAYSITLPVWGLMAFAMLAGVIDMAVLSRFTGPLSRM